MANLVLTTNLKAPISDTADYIVKRTDGVNAVMFQNAGTSTIYFDMKWTLKPGGNRMIGSQTDTNVLDLKYHITFDTSGGAVNRLEIEELTLKNC